MVTGRIRSVADAAHGALALSAGLTAVVTAGLFVAAALLFASAGALPVVLT